MKAAAAAAPAGGGGGGPAKEEKKEETKKEEDKKDAESSDDGPGDFMNFGGDDYGDDYWCSSGWDHYARKDLLLAVT